MCKPLDTLCLSSICSLCHDLKVKERKNSEVTAMLLAIGPHTKRGLDNTSRNDRLVAFSELASNFICPQNGVFSICGETKCPALVLLRFQHKEHLWEVSFYCVRFASKLTVLRLSKVFHIFAWMHCGFYTQEDESPLNKQCSILSDRHRVRSGHGKSGKSMDFVFENSRPGNSMEVDEKFWKEVESFGKFLFRKGW